MRSTVLVTGATGFLGGHLARRLVESSRYNVRALVRKNSNSAPLEALGVERFVHRSSVGVHGDIDDPPLYRRRVDFFRKTRAFSIEKAQEVLGFSPKVGLEQGLRQTIDWYEEQGLL